MGTKSAAAVAKLSVSKCYAELQAGMTMALVRASGIQTEHRYDFGSELLLITHRF